ncbi:hypothetical protein EAG_03784 [Camponotus floridanus]|uniref:Uncharacterized protein n=1 Tax=Camponotus floridanus TaxID=104421 RepID=E2APL8_CAMFO|nr:hypothetical protein EAG_03784 [Camponotus floridanus]
MYAPPNMHTIGYVKTTQLTGNVKFESTQNSNVALEAIGVISLYAFQSFMHQVFVLKEPICNYEMSIMKKILRNSLINIAVESIHRPFNCVAIRLDVTAFSNRCYHVMRSTKLTIIDLMELLTTKPNRMLKTFAKVFATIRVTDINVKPGQRSLTVIEIKE